MVGLPYPNRTSPELNEKMAYLDKCVGVSLYAPLKSVKSALSK